MSGNKALAGRCCIFLRKRCSLALSVHAFACRGDAEEPAHRLQPQLGDSIWMPGVTPEGHVIRFQYEVRTLVYWSDASTARATYHALHWQKRARPHTAMLMALISLLLQFSDSLARLWMDDRSCILAWVNSAQASRHRGLRARCRVQRRLWPNGRATR